MKDVLILTVGTGTSGRYSNLAQGLSTTIRRLEPRLCWLVPSMSHDSLAVAEMVRESERDAAGFERWDATSEYCRIADPDDLYDCREVLRRVIRRARQSLYRGERLLVNPTSGTKQMSVAAVLAALDEGLGEIVFTVGDRVDGVVKSGSERFAVFQTERFYMEQALKQAEQLFRAGSYRGAAELLEPYEHDAEVQKSGEVARCTEAWQRLDYTEACRLASRSEASELIKRRVVLQRLANSADLSVPRIGDLLFNARHLLHIGQLDDALGRCYRAMEQAGKTRLWEEHHIKPPYQLAELMDAAPSMAPRLRALARDGFCQIGLRLCFEVLDSLNDPFAQAYFRNQKLQRLLNLRNQTAAGHGTGSVTETQAREVILLSSEFLQRFFPGIEDYWSPRHRPETLLESGE